MGKRLQCVACNVKFTLSELHIDPATSDWYCDPCYQVMMIERIDPEEKPADEWLDDEEESDNE